MQNEPVQYSARQLLESARRAEADGNIDLAGVIARFVVDNFANTKESAEAYANLVRLGQWVRPTAAQPYIFGGYGTAQMRPVTGQAPQSRIASAWVSNPYVAPHAPGRHQAVQYITVQPAMRALAPAVQMQPAQVPVQAPTSPAHASRGPMPAPVPSTAATFAPAAPYRATQPQPHVTYHARQAKRQHRGGRLFARFTVTAGWLMMLAGCLSPVPSMIGLVGPAPSVVWVALVAGALIAGGLLALLGGRTALDVFDRADNMRDDLERPRWDA